MKIKGTYYRPTQVAALAVEVIADRFYDLAAYLWRK